MTKYTALLLMVLGLNTPVLASQNTANLSPNTAQPSAQSATQPTTVPANPHDPNADTMLDLITPNDSELSQANQQLLAKNAELSFAVDNLTTQVHVLTQERSGQLFTYGAMTAIFSMIIGFVFAKLLNKKDRW